MKKDLLYGVSETEKEYLHLRNKEEKEQWEEIHGYIEDYISKDIYELNLNTIKLRLIKFLKQNSFYEGDGENLIDVYLIIDNLYDIFNLKEEK